MIESTLGRSQNPIMSIDRNAPPHSVTSLLKSVEMGDLGLPEFQRSFLWRPSDVVELLRTIARQWPCGTFLLQEGPQPFACKPLNGAPPLKPQPKLLVLDGQQRLTAIYHAVRERGQETYYVDIGKLRDAKALDDDHVRFQRTAKYHSLYPTLQTEAEARVVRVATLTKDAEFFQWASFLPEPIRSDAIRLRDEQLGGFKHYSIPCVVLEVDLPLSAVAKIFETLNRTGVKLDTFDLMVAKLYPFQFRLRDEWAAARERFSETIGRYEIDGIEILKAIALREHLRQVKSEVSPVTVKGVRESDVIELEATTVKSEWNDTVVAYHSALDFLRSQCGVVSPRLLPALAMVLPIANAISQTRRKRTTFQSDLKRWFWSACVQQTYAQGANTQCVRDARQLEGWMANRTQVPDAVASFSGVDEDALCDARRRNEILTRSLLCAIVLRGAHDWFTNELLLNAGQPLDASRVASRQEMKVAGDIDAVVDYTVLTVGSQRKATQSSLSEVVSKVGAQVLRQHLIPDGAFRAAEWAGFRKQRSRLAAEALNALARGLP